MEKGTKTDTGGAGAPVTVGDGTLVTDGDGDGRGSHRPDYAPHDESGFSHVDALEKATEGDEVYIEFDIRRRSGVYGVRGDVKTVREREQDDGRMVEKTYVIAGDHPDFLRIDVTLVTDTRSAYNFVQDEMKYADDSGPPMHESTFGDVHTVEVYQNDAE